MTFQWFARDIFIYDHVTDNNNLKFGNIVERFTEFIQGHLMTVHEIDRQMIS